MKELIEIVRAYDEAKAQAKQCALVTLVHVEGSSYRRPGARMLVTESGELTGAISGGCLEGDALNKALLAMHQQRNMLVTYDTTDEDDAVLGLGLGCNGVIQVLIQPLKQDSDTELISLLKGITSERTNHVVVTLFSLNGRKAEQTGTAVYMKNDQLHYIHEVDPSIKQLLSDDIRMAYQTGRSTFKEYKWPGGETTAYIECIAPAVSLVIAGAGNDVDPVVSFASSLGWQVTLIDDGRDRNVKNSRFAGACHLKATDPAEALRLLVIDSRTFFLLMTHNYNYDKAMLGALLPMNVRYIGVLGPKKKMDRMLGELVGKGHVLTDEQLKAIHSPVGLDIGAETPEEIALSMIAEIRAVIAGKDGQPMHKKPDVIHSRNETIIETRQIV